MDSNSATVDAATYPLALVVVTYNSERCIRKCLESAFVHVVRGGDCRLVVVDNASTDQTRSILSEYETMWPDDMTVIFLTENVGFGAANNRAFAVVPADAYVLINPDAWLIGNTVDQAVSAMATDATVAIAGVPLIYADGSAQTHAFAFTTWQKWLLQSIGLPVLARWLARRKVIRVLLGRIPMAREYMRTHSRLSTGLTGPAEEVAPGAMRTVDWVCGAGMIVRGDFVRDSGGFDSKIFLYGEDEDICMEARDWGRRVVVVETVPVVHELGWSKSKVNDVVARMKYESLRYFITKRHGHSISGYMLNRLLRLHVFGWKGWLSSLWEGVRRHVRPGN